VKSYLKYDDIKVFKYENLYLALIYTIGHIFVAMACNRIITGASLNVAAADALIEPIINGFWFYFLLVFLKKSILKNIGENKLNFINTKKIGLVLAILYTIGHILIAMTCNRLLTGAPLNLAAIDAFIEPIINGFWFYILFEVFNNFKKKKISGGFNLKNNSYGISKLAPINNKKLIDRTKKEI